MHFASGSSGGKAPSDGNDRTLRKPRQGAVPIRRPIQVLIRRDQIAILQSRHEDDGFSEDGTVIFLAQPNERIFEEFVTALRKHMDGWGLAGNGLYWRPVLQLHVGPRGEPQAARLVQWLEGSGIEIDRPSTARQNRQLPARTTR